MAGKRLAFREPKATELDPGDLVGPLVDPLEEERREIALAGIREHREDHRTLRRLLGDLSSGRECPAGGDPAEDSLLGGELAGRVAGLRVGNEDDLVVDALVENRRYEVGRQIG